MTRYTVGVVLKKYKEVNIDAPTEGEAERQAVEYFEEEYPEKFVEPHMIVDSSEDT